jgi:P4 family phage/plasmid primase-like protien
MNQTSFTEKSLSVFKNAKGTNPICDISLQDFFAEIRDGAHRVPVLGIRSATNGSAAELKKKLQAVSLSGRITEGDRAQAIEEKRFDHSGFLQIDIDGDGLGNRSPQEIRELFAADPHIVCTFISPSGKGTKGVMRIPPAKTKEEHQAAFLSAEDYLQERYQVKIDKSTKDPGRLCFVSYDPEARWNDSATTLEVTTRPVDERKTTSTPKNAITSSFPDPPREGIHAWLMEGAWWCRKSGMTEEEAVAKLNSYDGSLRRRLEPKEVENACETVFSTILTSHGTRATIKRPSAVDMLSGDAIPDLTCYGESDADNALRVHAIAGGRFHFVGDSGQWIIWNGCRWIPDKDGFMIRLYLATMEETARQGLKVDRHTGERIVKHAMKSRDASKTSAALVMLRSVAGVTVSASDLDADPWLLGTPNGIVDLRTGKAIAPDKRALITKSISCDLDTEATCPTWERVIRKAADGDAELIQFLQSWTGYTLTGSVREECLAFLHGTGANSKGTVTEAIRHLMGDYAMTAPESLFVADRNSSATNDIARLAGCRMACAAELDEGASFAENRLKAITGRDAITARFLHREFFDFAPTHKFWISGNHKPTVRGTDHGIWRRMRLIPFAVTIPKEERDLDLADKLRAEMTGILNWAIQGCLAWQRDGLVTPQCVIAATASYQAQEDILGQFLEDSTEMGDEDARTLQCEVFTAYVRWTDQQGIKKPLSATMLNRKLEDRGFQKSKSNSKRYWKGISIKPW